MIGSPVHFRQLAMPATDTLPAIPDRCVPGIVVSISASDGSVVLTTWTPAEAICANVDFDIHATDESGWTPGTWHPMHNE